MVRASSPVHVSWQRLLEPLAPEIDRILGQIEGENTAPSRELIFRALELDFEKIKVVIFGQDPYPTPGNAMGMAFSIPPEIVRLPASLRNIFQELESDLGVRKPLSGDLAAWERSGVLLLNRVLTTRVGESAAHANLGWQRITDFIAKELGSRGVVAILWGKSAQELSQYFEYQMSSAHPSPLSAYRGFFGSKPFSRANELLVAQGREPIDWSL
jgi:uracil-DNA glycosylase